MKNILIPTDFSENSWNAITYALDYFKGTSCNFYLLHVTLISNYMAVGEPPIYQTNEVLVKPIIEQAKTSLQNQLKKIKELTTNPNHHFYPITNYDFFINAVKTQIKEKNIDLIVMGTKGASGISEVIVGSNTGDLITKVKCPVLIVPENATFSIPKEIAFPTDYDISYQGAILNTIHEFASKYNSSIRVLHIAPKNKELTSFQIENKGFLQEYFTDEKHSFHRITSNKIEAGVQCFVESRNINLIVMVAKNINLFQRILFKPTVEEISYHIEIPFLVLHE